MPEWFLLIANFTDISFGTSPFSHLWSVCVEMHFYLLLPLIALINKKYRNYFLIFLILFSCLLNFYLVNNLTIDEIWILTISHIGSFSIGALIANNETNLKKFAYGREVLVLLIPALVIYTTSSSFFHGRFSGINYLISSIMYSIMILIGLNNPTRKNNFLHFLGERSYSIYLTHFTVIIIFMAKFKPGEVIRTGTATLQQTMFCFLIVIFVASLEFSIFERQILKFKSKVKFIKT
jgi:peptidoglycan/LPS O-acetylase OafA/YrhL